MELKFTVVTKIQKPIAEVFEAVYNPEKLSGYFTNGGASAPLDEGTTVHWSFEDTPGKPIPPFPVNVLKSIPEELIEFEWEGSKGRQTQVKFEFEQTGPSETLVKISESGWEESQEELDRSYMNCMGWSQFLSALKAYVEYGINLRKGAYSGLFDATDFKESSQSAG
ncbi:MAG TPA: SRPBCC domain-containing protein [Pyrinomonadaceae bacterium]|nr:SRPBCC domain-containing protein [Pyrinomonadaceae bacterium]